MQVGIIINTMTFEARELMNAASKYFPGMKVTTFKNDDFKFSLYKNEDFTENVDIFLQRSLSFSRALYSSFILENYGYKVISSYD